MAAQGDFMKIKNLQDILAANTYPGRGIMIGRTPDGTQAVIVYFIMGRSANSRNRVFTKEGEGIRTEAFDPSKMEDPSLIIYAPVRVQGNYTIVTNGDQTDTIYDGLARGLTFEQSLRPRRFEPDLPNCTPRISGLVDISGGEMQYWLSILKSADGNPESDLRFTFSFRPAGAGEGRFISTYQHDGNPLPSFEGEPVRVAVGENIDAVTDSVWNALDPDNKVSLFVRFIDIATGKYETRIVNKNS